MEQRFDRIEDKLDSLDNKLDNIDKTLAVNTEQLSVHIKRTNLLEEHVLHSETKIIKIEKHVVVVNTIFKIIMVLGSVAAFLIGAALSLGKFLVH